MLDWLGRASQRHVKTQILEILHQINYVDRSDKRI
jgi:hypothetical protein